MLNIEYQTKSNILRQTVYQTDPVEDWSYCLSLYTYINQQTTLTDILLEYSVLLAIEGLDSICVS